MSSQRVEHSFRESKSAKVLAKNLFDFWKKGKERPVEERLEDLKDIFETMRKQQGRDCVVEALQMMISRVEALLMRHVKLHVRDALYLKDQEAQKRDPRHESWRKEYSSLLHFLNEEQYRLRGKRKSNYGVGKKMEVLSPYRRERLEVRMCEEQFYPLIDKILKEKSNLTNASEEMTQLAGVLLGLEYEFALSGQLKVLEKAVVEAITNFSFQFEFLKEKMPQEAKAKYSSYMFVIKLLRNVLRRIERKSEKKNNT